MKGRLRGYINANLLSGKSQGKSVIASGRAAVVPAAEMTNFKYQIQNIKPHPWAACIEPFEKPKERWCIQQGEHPELSVGRRGLVRLNAAQTGF
jgi:hypothetical protein